VTEPLTEAGRVLLREHSSGTPHMARHILAIEAEARATPTPDTRLREALLSIIGEAEEVTEAQHGTPHGALYAIIRRAREALADD